MKILRGVLLTVFVLICLGMAYFGLAFAIADMKARHSISIFGGAIFCGVAVITVYVTTVVIKVIRGR